MLNLFLTLGKYITFKHNTVNYWSWRKQFLFYFPTKYQLWSWKSSHLVIHALKVKNVMIIKVTYFLSCLQPLFDAGWICQLFCWPKTFVRPFALPLLAILHSFLKNKNKRTKLVFVIRCLTSLIYRCIVLFKFSL